MRFRFRSIAILTLALVGFFIVSCRKSDGPNPAQSAGTKGSAACKTYVIGRISEFGPVQIDGGARKIFLQVQIKQCSNNPRELKEFRIIISSLARIFGSDNTIPIKEAEFLFVLDQDLTPLYNGYFDLWKANKL